GDRPALRGRTPRLRSGWRRGEGRTGAAWSQGDRLMAPRRHHRQPRDRSVECELKFRVAGPGDHARLRSALRKLGYRLEGTYDEENFRFVGPGKTTRRTTLRLRVLDGGPRGVLTAKGEAHFVA